MAIRVKQLKCKVHIHSSVKKKPLLHGEEKAEAPSMVYAMPIAQPKQETNPEPSIMATKERGAAAGDRSGADPRRADPRAIADRVYELLLRELRLSTELGDRRYRG